MKNFFPMEMNEEVATSQTKEVLRAYLLLTVLSVFLVLVHFLAVIATKNLGLHIPGLSGIIWMPLLVIGKIKSKTKLAATYMAAVSSALVLWISPAIGMGKIGGMWLFPFLRYGIPGAALDLLWPLTKNFANKPFVYLFAVSSITALAHICKVPFSIITWHFGFGQYVMKHFTLTTITLLYFVLGAAGGAMGYLIANSKAAKNNFKNNI